MLIDKARRTPYLSQGPFGRGTHRHFALKHCIHARPYVLDRAGLAPRLSILQFCLISLYDIIRVSFGISKLVNLINAKMSAAERSPSNTDGERILNSESPARVCSVLPNKEVKFFAYKIGCSHDRYFVPLLFSVTHVQLCSKDKMEKKTVLITGCSQGGIGASLVKAFHAKGYHVFATLRNKSKADPFFIASDDITVVDLEVTSAESVKACAGYVAGRTGGTLDVLVNNAGMGLCRPLLDTDIDEAKKVYDLNVWGVLSMTRSFAPMLVKAKGVLLNISSVAACFTFAWSGMPPSACPPLSFTIDRVMTRVKEYTTPPKQLRLSSPKHYASNSPLSVSKS